MVMMTMIYTMNSNSKNSSSNSNKKDSKKQNKDIINLKLKKNRSGGLGEGKSYKLFYRGCTFSKEYFKSFFKKNDIIVFPAFTSMSTDEEESKKYAVEGGEKRIIF